MINPMLYLKRLYYRIKYRIHIKYSEVKLVKRQIELLELKPTWKILKWYYSPKLKPVNLVDCRTLTDIKGLALLVANHRGYIGEYPMTRQYVVQACILNKYVVKLRTIDTNPNERSY